MAWTAVGRVRGVLSIVLALVLTAAAARVAGFGVFDDILRRVGAVTVGALVIALTVPVFADLSISMD